MAKESKILKFAEKCDYEVDEVTSLILRLLEANSDEPERLAEIEQCVDKGGSAWSIWLAYTGSAQAAACGCAEQTRLF